MRARRRRIRRGALMVEAALVLPILFALIFGLVILGAGVFADQQVTSLAREGARYASVHGATYAKETGGSLATDVSIYANTILPMAAGLDTSQITHSVIWDDSGQNPVYQSSVTTNAYRINYVTVTVGYTWHMPAFPGSASQTLTLTGRSRMSRSNLRAGTGRVDMTEPNLGPSGRPTTRSLTKGTEYTLWPGSYHGNGGPSFPSLSSGGVAIFKQANANSAGGLYYLYSGLKSHGGSMTMDPLTSGGIMLYNAGSGTSQVISISGNGSGTVTLTALDGSVSSSVDYKGILYLQARRSTQDVSVSGNGSFTMDGTFYAPDASLKMTGNTSAPPSIIGSQYIAKGLIVSGGGSVVIDYSSGLVAPTRSLGIVE